MSAVRPWIASGVVDPASFFAASRLLIVAGKGGVGKTVVSATLARAAARAGLSTLVIEVEGKSGLATHVRPGRPRLRRGRAGRRRRAGGRGRGAGPHPHPRRGAARVPRRPRAVADLQAPGVLRRPRRGGHRRPGHQGHPGPRQGEAARAERRAPTSSCSTPPPPGTPSPSCSRPGACSTPCGSGPINAQARDVLEMLTDHDRCQVVLVTLPEETPVNELVETAFSLEDQVGVGLGPVVVNGLYDDRARARPTPPAQAAEAAGATLRPGEAEALAAAASFRADRTALQAEQVGRLADAAAAPPDPPALPVHRRARPGRARPAGRPPAGRDRRPPGGGVMPSHASLALELVAERADPRLLRVGRRGQDHHRRRAGPGGGPGRAVGPSSSPSTRPSGWPTPSASRASPASPAGSRATGPASCGR